MAGKTAFPVICVVLSVTQQLHGIFPTLLPHFRPMRRYGYPNEILGSGPTLRPPPGVLIAGHGPHVARPLGPVHHVGRPFPFSPSSSPPTPSSWPTAGPQIQRAREASHFEYEVVPPPMSLPKPPTLMRLAPQQRFQPRPIQPTQHPATVPPEMVKFLAQESFPQQSRTDRPPVVVTGYPQVGNTPFATPSDADFQEGFRILSDLFKENAGADIRSNLIGGSEISFNDGYLLPRATPTSPTKRNVTLPNNTAELVQIFAAREKPLLIEAGTPEETRKIPEKAQSTPGPVYVKPTSKPSTVMQGSESSYGPPHFQAGPQSHVSFMFTDPNEAPPGAYNLYDDSPPPPFNLGNSIIPPPPTPTPPQGKNPNDVRGVPQNQPPPPQAQSSPQNAGYNNGPPPTPGPGGKYIRNEIPPPPPFPPNNGQQPFVMLPVGAHSPTRNNNEIAPSSDEVQKALSVLARYASKQAQGMGLNVTPQMILQQEGGSMPIPGINYGPPPPNPGNKFGPPPPNNPGNKYGPPPPNHGGNYGPPPPQQSTPSSSFFKPTVESVTLGAPVRIQSTPNSYTTTTEANTVKTSVSQSEESSPFPQYGAPLSHVLTGGWSSGSSNGPGLIGAKVQALQTIAGAVTGGLKTVTGLKAGIFNAGLSAIGSLGKAKGDIANSLKIPIVSNKNKKPSPIYGAPSQPSPTYGAPQQSYQSSNHQGWGQPEEQQDGPIIALANGVRDVVGGITGAITQTGRAAVGIGKSKNKLISNHFVIKGQAFTDVVSKKIANKNEYFQNVMKHIQSIFEAAAPNSGWSSSPPEGY